MEVKESVKSLLPKLSSVTPLLAFTVVSKSSSLSLEAAIGVSLVKCRGGGGSGGGGPLVIVSGWCWNSGLV